MSDWVVGKVRTNSESKIAGTLEEIGVEAYCPMLKRKRRSPGSAVRERIEEPALPGYIPIRAAHMEAPESREELYRNPDFYDFIRDVSHAVVLMMDSALDPLRAMENAEPVKFISGPAFYLGETVRVPPNNGHVLKAFWGMKGQVVSVKNGRYCLGGHDFTKETWFSGCQLLRPAV